MARNGDLTDEFLFFAVHGGHLYKQPTDVRDYQTSLAGVAHHPAREDYLMHGTVVKMPLQSVNGGEAVVTQVCSREMVMAAVASLPGDAYEDVLQLF
jgi:hypothetical protein